MIRRIVVATGNRHKVQELSQLLQNHGLVNVELVPMSEFPITIEIEEDGLTFEENALIKANAVFQATGLPTLADDSGLCIDALNGAPGVRSARFAGTGSTDAENRDAVRTALADAGCQTSSARFVCVLCYVDALRTMLTVGESVGHVSNDDRGSGGFGYDPMFTPTGYDVTYAELSAEKKNTLSHRARAFETMAHRLVALDDDTVIPNTGRLSLTDLCSLSVASVIGRGDIVRSISHRVNDEQERRKLTEAILQTYLFAGFPATLDAMMSLSEGAEHPILVDKQEPYDVELFSRRGEELCRKIYGRVYEKMMLRFEDLSPSLRSWMIIEGYGKTLSRDGLETLERELCIVCILAALGRTSQLYSHIRGALTVGATSDDLACCMHVVAEICGNDAAQRIAVIVESLTSHG